MTTAGRGNRSGADTPAESAALDELVETADFTIQNVVMMSDVGQEIELEQVAREIPDARYDPDQFPGIIYRLEAYRATMFLFQSGKVVCTGAGSREDARAAVREVCGELADLGVSVEDHPITVENVVASGDLGVRLNLNAIAIGLGLEDVEYEPEQFPGLVYPIENPRAVLLLFGTGRCIVTGANAIDDSGVALAKVRSELADLGLLD